ncbi:hypothetical protein GCK72_012584 [Caenorhabditis remanei]|uniref:Uncharacterized protein n=1 Tax=Caenorhabditis remanei TaxID=31234 RepID=A0A6A5GNC4_CAERE|nr:hypothetical protein GCK72_012584 [Caenorhabditis remanei]KAF1756131.1 hypothetical protein GCK72_012584 [Caenorhabditis remanei]
MAGVINCTPTSRRDYCETERDCPISSKCIEGECKNVFGFDNVGNRNSMFVCALACPPGHYCTHYTNGCVPF